MFQDGFQIVIDEVTQKCQGYFLNRFYSAYITGSISTNEAISGESDLDYWGFVNGELSNDDRIWINKTEVEIDYKHDIVNGVHINIKTIEELRKDKFARFVLKYNSILYFGFDLIAEIEVSSFDIYKPDKVIAKERLSFARNCLEDAMKNTCPQCIDKIPVNTYIAARKYARYFILVEGAYFLMAKNKFETFKQERVIRQLKEICNGDFNNVLDLSIAVLQDPFVTAIKHDDYIVRIYPFVKRLFEEIESA